MDIDLTPALQPAEAPVCVPATIEVGPETASALAVRTELAALEVAVSLLAEHDSRESMEPIRDRIVALKGTHRETLEEHSHLQGLLRDILIVFAGKVAAADLPYREFFRGIHAA